LLHNAIQQALRPLLHAYNLLHNGEYGCYHDAAPTTL
jgi:hypothetical protein